MIPAAREAGNPCPYNRDFAARVLDNPFYCRKIVYYRRTNRSMDEQNQRKEITVRGKQEAIIPKEMWERVQEKRKEMAVHYEKDEPDRISMLSGLVKCPLCGVGMVMQKNKRINKNRGGYYKPIYYYACRNYRKSEGRRCSFKHTQFPVFYGEDGAAGDQESDETVAFVLDCRKLPVTVPEAKA